MTPRFSVVVPLYNKGAYIMRAVNSILSQTVEDFEIIVIDDGSTDNGPELVSRISDIRVRLVHQPNSGVSAARNHGIQVARGDLVSFLDADDEWDSDFLATIDRLAKRFPRAGAYATAYRKVLKSGKIIIPKFKGIPPPPWEGIVPSYFRSELGPPLLSASSVAVPKIIFSEVGGFVLNEALGEDLDMWGRIAMKYPVVFTWKVCSSYHLDAKGRACACLSYSKSKPVPFIKTARMAIRTKQVPDDMVLDLQNCISKYMIEDAKICLLWARRRKISREMLRSCQPTTFQLLFLKSFWLLLSCFPLPLLRLGYILKQKFIDFMLRSNLTT